MTDIAAQVAEFFVNETRGMPFPERLAALRERFPTLNTADLKRGIEIAQEILRADGAEYLAKADTLDELARKRRAAR